MFWIFSHQNYNSHQNYYSANESSSLVLHFPHRGCPASRRTTEDGFELVMGANYFGQVYLAENLMDLMKRRGGGRSRFSRVVFVSSKLSLTAKLDPWNFDLNMNGQAYHVERQYARAKLAQAMYVCHLAKRMEGSGIAAVALCTGKCKYSTYLSTK